MSFDRWAGNLGILLAVLCFAYAGQSLIKLGLFRVGEFRFSASLEALSFFLRCAANPYVLGGTVLVGCGFMLWIAFLSHLELSQALPMLALSYVPWLIIGAVFFGEQVTPLRVVGVVLISIGVLCVGYSGGR